MGARGYIGVSSKARRIKRVYVGVDGKARRVKKIYVGVNGKARLCWVEQNPATLAYSQTLNNSLPDMCSNGTSVGNYVVFAGGRSGTSSSAYGLNTYCTYDTSLAQNTGRAFTSNYGMVYGVGVYNGQEACFLNVTTYSYSDIYGTSMGLIRRVNASLTAAETSTSNYVSRSAVVAHKGSILEYGGLTYSNGSNDYSTSHGSAIYRYNGSYTKSSISVSPTNGIYECDGASASVGNYAIIQEKSYNQRAFTVNQSFTLGQKITFTGTFGSGSATDKYAIFQQLKSTQLFCVNTSLTISYVNTSYQFKHSVYTYNRPLVRFGDSVVTATVGATNSSSYNCSHWMIINDSLTTRVIARTNVSANTATDNYPESPYGVVGPYIIRGGPSYNALYSKIEVLKS